MRDMDRRNPGRAVAITTAGRGNNQFVEIVTLSLIGLILAMAEIAQYAGTDVLRAMFIQ